MVTTISLPIWEAPIWGLRGWLWLKDQFGLDCTEKDRGGYGHPGTGPGSKKKKKNTAFGQTHREGTSVLLDAVAS